jgi:hypothetical protein
MAAPPKPGHRLTPDALTEQVLTQSQSSREVIQDFVPLAESLEWDLGQQYLRKRGNKAFISDASPVPFLISNDGALSPHAAEVFVASPGRKPPCVRQRGRHPADLARRPRCRPGPLGEARSVREDSSPDQARG